MNKLTALALIIAFIAAWSYSAGKRSAKPIQQPQAEPVKPHKIVVDVTPLPNIPTRFGARDRANIAFAEAVRANVERKVNGNR